MFTFTFECQNEAQLAALRQAAHFLAEMHQLAQATPAGQVLSSLEGHALDAGRDPSFGLGQATFRKEAKPADKRRTHRLGEVSHR